MVHFLAWMWITVCYKIFNVKKGISLLFAAVGWIGNGVSGQETKYDIEETGSYTANSSHSL
jgi:hypothetical protein